MGGKETAMWGRMAMGLSTIIVRWLDAEQAGDVPAKNHARHMLVTNLWEVYRPILYALARRHAPGQQSDILNSAFLKFFEQVDRHLIQAKTRDELFRILMRKVLDKVFERARKESRRRDLGPVLAENALVPAPNVGDASSGLRDGIAQWAIASEPPPEFEAITNEMLEAVPDPELRQVLLLKIEHLLRSRNVSIAVARANVEIAKIIGISDREVGRRLEEVREILGPWWHPTCGSPEGAHADETEGDPRECE